MSEYLVVIEKAGKNCSAYVPDLPGCVATGKTRSAARAAIRAAVAFHIEGMLDDGLKIPKPSAQSAKVSVITRGRRSAA